MIIFFYEGFTFKLIWVKELNTIIFVIENKIEKKNSLNLKSINKFYN